MDFLKSFGIFLFGILKRIYYLLPSIASDPFDIAERWFGMNYTAPPYTFWILLTIGLAIAIYLTYRELHNEKTKMGDTATQIFGSDMGKHITTTKGILKKWKKQLSKMTRQRKLVELRTDIETKMANKNDFWYFLMHCPSVEKKYEELRSQREIYTMHSNVFVYHENGKTIRSEPRKEDIIEQRKYLNEAMQSLIEMIDHSLSMSYEYSKRRCPFCPQDMTKI